MKNPNQLITFATTILLATSTFNSALAFNPQPEPPPGPAIGVVDTQTIAITAVTPPQTIVGAEPVRLILALFNASGEAIKMARVEAMPGTIQALSVSGTELGLRSGERMRVYGVAQCVGTEQERALCAQNIQTSFELYKTRSGETQLVVPGGQALFFDVLGQ